MAGNNRNILKVVSYNCNSIRKKVDIIRRLLNNCDILVCQEIILLEEDSDFVHGISDEYHAHVVPSKPSSSHLNEGRPFGGMVIFYRKLLNIKLNVIANHEHFNVYTINSNFLNFHLVNVYLPCDSRSAESLSSYQSILGELQMSLNALPGGHLLCVGDYNADPNKGRFWPYVNDFLDYNNLVMNDLTLPIDSFHI